jgi:hypothetical protein
MAGHEKQAPEHGVDTYSLLLESFLSEQMSLAQLREHMERDPAFREYVLAHFTPPGSKPLWS